MLIQCKNLNAYLDIHSVETNLQSVVLQIIIG